MQAEIDPHDPNSEINLIDAIHTAAFRMGRQHRLVIETQKATTAHYIGARRWRGTVGLPR